MEAMGEQNPLAQHPLVTSSKFNLGNRKGMSEMQASVHVWVWKVSEPLGVFLLDLFLGEASEFLGRGCIDLKDTLLLPSILVLGFERLEIVSFRRLEDRQPGRRLRRG